MKVVGFHFCVVPSGNFVMYVNSALTEAVTPPMMQSHSSVEVIAVGPDGAIVVAGAILDTATIVVERYDENGMQQARYERSGRFSTGVAVDEDCHAYVVGFSNGGDGAWLERLR